VIEPLAADIQARHNIRSLHIFAQGPNWRVFASRGTVAFQASVEEGRGPDIETALRNLDERLTAGPINRGELADLIDAGCGGLK
jgi:hypothetical protein